jgi:hypothetical protein
VGYAARANSVAVAARQGLVAPKKAERREPSKDAANFEKLWMDMLDRVHGVFRNGKFYLRDGAALK